MGPSDRLLRAVAQERATLERQRAQLAREADALRASLRRIEAGMAEIDTLTARLDGLAPAAAEGRDENAGAAASRGAATTRAGAASRRPASSPRDAARPDAAGSSAPGSSAAARRAAAPANLLRGPAIREVAVALLVADGRDALHYRAWFDLLTQAGYDVAGKDPLAVFLTQITRSPAIRKGARPGEYALDRDARATHEARLRRLNQQLAALPSQTTDLTELRARRAQLTAEITKVEKALEELQRAA